LGQPMPTFQLKAHRLPTKIRLLFSCIHSRFGLGGDVLEPYKKIIDRWLWPDVLRNQDTSVSQAKQAISDYKKAVGDLEGVAELMVLYCEQAAGFCDAICSDDEGYFDALVRMVDSGRRDDG